MPIRGTRNSTQEPRATRADERGRASRTSTTSGTSRAGASAKTAKPALFSDWKDAVVDAAARELARKEMQPELDDVLAHARKENGGILDEDTAASVSDAFFDDHDAQVTKLAAKHAKKLSADKDATIKRVVDDFRARVDQRRDPFSPVAAKDPVARSREVVLWENAQAMVLVDLFSAFPKALVVPKQRTMFPTDASSALLDEVARVAAHVSDAFASVTGSAPSTIWINPPHDLTVKQLHVHVMPDVGGDWRKLLGLPPTTGRRERAIDVAKVARNEMFAVFQKLTQALESNLGPST